MFTWLPLDLLTICAFAVACALVGLFGLVSRWLVKRSRRTWVEVGVFAVVGLLGLGGLALGAPSTLWAACFGVLTVGAVLALFRLAFLARLGRAAQILLGHSAVVWLGLMLVGTSALVAQLVDLEEQTAPTEFPEAAFTTISPADALRPVESQWAVTDKGHVIPLFTILPGSGVLPPDGDTNFLAHHRLESALIRTDEADTHYNCHGFVFTGGRYWIGGSNVERILRDNGYQETTAPRPGDIIVYRENATGLIVHTGLVRTVIEETGTVLIESKLGSMGRFIHTADTQPYDNTTSTYYHTGRGGHILHGLDGMHRPASGVYVHTGAVSH